MKRGCLTWFGVYLAIALGLGVWFDASVREPVSDTSPPPAAMPSRAGLVIGGALAGALPGLFAVSMIASAAARLKERDRLRRSEQGARPRDGERGVVFGRIMREGPSLTAPLSGRECVLYRYQISHLESRPSIRRDSPSAPSRTVVDAEGFALTPSVIQTAAGLVKLRAFVKPEFRADRFTMSDAGARVNAYLAATTFRGRGSLEDDPRALQAVLGNGEGAIRYDRGTGKIDPGVSPWLEEHVVLNGDEVCVFGRYSSSQEAMVPDPDGPALVPTRLRKGSLRSLARRLGLDAIGIGLGAAAWAALAAAWAFMFPIFGPSLW